MSGLSRRQLLGRAAATAAAVTLGAPAIHAQRRGRTLRFVAQADLKILDPIWTTAYITRNHGYLVYDTLFGTDERLQVKPQMVDHHTVSADGMTYTFTLRDGLLWHDGQPVRAEDCVESLGWLRPNHLHPPFNNKKARQALLHAMDQVTYLHLSIGQAKYYRPCYSVFACGSPYKTNAGAEPIVKHDLERARRLVKESGYDGRPVVVIQPTDIPIMNAAALVTRQRLSAIGFNVHLKEMDWSSGIAVRARKDPPDKGGWNILHTWWSAADVMDPAVHFAVSGAGTNAAFRKEVQGVLQFLAPLFWNVTIK